MNSNNSSAHKRHTEGSKNPNHSHRKSPAVKSASKKNSEKHHHKSETHSPPSTSFQKEEKPTLEPNVAAFFASAAASTNSVPQQSTPVSFPGYPVQQSPAAAAQFQQQYSPFLSYSQPNYYSQQQPSVPPLPNYQPHHERVHTDPLALVSNSKLTGNQPHVTSGSIPIPTGNQNHKHSQTVSSPSSLKYAGSSFHKSPVPSSLPIPVFSSSTTTSLLPSSQTMATTPSRGKGNSGLSNMSPLSTSKPVTSSSTSNNNFVNFVEEKQNTKNIPNGNDSTSSLQQKSRQLFAMLQASSPSQPTSGSFPFKQ